MSHRLCRATGCLTVYQRSPLLEAALAGWIIGARTPGEHVGVSSARVHVITLPLNSCITLDKFLNHSGLRLLISKLGESLNIRRKMSLVLGFDFSPFLPTALYQDLMNCPERCWLYLQKESLESLVESRAQSLEVSTKLNEPPIEQTEYFQGVVVSS